MSSVFGWFIDNWGKGFDEKLIPSLKNQNTSFNVNIDDIQTYVERMFVPTQKQYHIDMFKHILKLME